MSVETQSTPRRSPLWMRIALGVSLAVNLAIAGVAVGAAFRVFGPDGMPRQASFGAAVIGALPKEDRMEIRKTTRKSMGARSSNRQTVARLVTNLQTEPFDAEATAAIISEQLDRQQSWAMTFQQEWLKRVSEMTPQERKDYAARIADAQTRHADRRKKFSRGPSE